MTELRAREVKRLDPAHSVIKPKSGRETRHSYIQSFNFATVTQLSKVGLESQGGCLEPVFLTTMFY